MYYRLCIMNATGPTPIFIVYSGVMILNVEVLFILYKSFGHKFMMHLLHKSN